MSSTPTENLPVLAHEQQTLIYWPSLSTAEQAFVAAYVENSYSLPEACNALKMNRGEANAIFRNPNVKRAVAEVQQSLDGIDFLNERWVKAQLLRIFPMAMGDEPVPMVTAQGEEIEARKFFPDIAMRVVEYVAPKAQKSTVNINVSNVHKLTDAQLEELAAKGLGRIVSEQ